MGSRLGCSCRRLCHLQFFNVLMLWAEMGAVDVAFTEATVGAGVSTVVLIATVFNLKRKAKD